MKHKNSHDRVHFFALCANLIRGILVDHARAQAASKRGGSARPVPLTDEAGALPARNPDLIAVDEALTRLARIDPRRARVVELRFFAGLTLEETAAALRTSVETVKRDWRVARLWLLRDLS